MTGASTLLPLDRKSMRACRLITATQCNASCPNPA